MRTCSSRVCVAVAGALLSAAVAAQQAPPQFRGGIDVVRIEVSVLDGDRRPVRGLAPGDFIVLEDGRPQAIVAFDEIEIPGRVAEPAARPRDAAPDVVTNVSPDGRLLVLLLDDALEPGPFQQRTKDIARSVVDRLGPDDRAAVVFTRETRSSQDFTGDRSKLKAAIDRHSAGFVFTTKRENRASQGDGLYYRGSIGTLAEVAKALVDVPHRRKVLVYIGVGVPINVEDASTPVKTGGDDGSSADKQGLAVAAIRELDEALRRARMSNVTVYSIDSAGLGGLEAYEAGHPGQLPPPAQMRDYMHAIAAGTGGRAAVEVTDYRNAIERVFEENGSYYLIGYRTARPAADGAFRRLEVRVQRESVVVRARSGFRPGETRKDSEAQASPLMKALAAVVPEEGIAMQVTAAPFARPGGPAVAIVAGLRHPIGETPVDAMEVQLVTSAFDTAGRSRGLFRQTARLKLRTLPDGEAEYEVLSRIALKPGRYSLRVAAHNPALGRTGSVFYDLVVPDFAKDPLSLSGVLVSATPKPPAAPKDALSALTSIVPTSRREFAAADDAEAVLWIYQHASKQPVDVAVKVRVLDESGAEVHGRTDAIAAARFAAGHAAEYRSTIPLAKLAPGAYLLEIEAAAGGRTAERTVSFSVR